MKRAQLELVVTWRPIPGFSGYEASDQGVIRPTNPRYSRGRGATLKPWIVERHGRLAAYVSLHINGKRHKHLVHRLVALAFYGPAPEGMNDCAHANHDSLDNRASNLKWSTHADNVQANFERDLDRRIRWEDDCDLGPRYHGPDRESGLPF